MCIKRILQLASTCAALGIGRCLCCMICGRTFTPPFDILTIISLTSGILLFDICRLHPSSSHTLKTLLSQYVVHKLLYVIGSMVHLSFKRRSKNCRQHQEELLMRIIKQNKNTKCAQKMGINKVNSVLEFVTEVPLTSYTDYKELVNEVETFGSENVFFPGKTDYLAATSGTSSGKSKTFPKKLDIFRKRTGPLFLLQQKCLLQLPRNNFLRKSLAVRTYPKFFYSKSGIKSGPIAGIASDVSLVCYVVPKRGGKTSNEADIIYMNLVFGLSDVKIGNLFFPTATLALTFFKTLEKNWKSVCDDIQNGTISNLEKIPYDLRDTFLQNLKGGNSERAEALRLEFQKGFEAVVPRIWPGCPALICISSGTFQTPAKILRDKYLGHVPIFSPYHVSTETAYGFSLNLKCQDHSYVAATTLNFFEFIEEDEIEKEMPRTTLAHQVEVGRVYEIVVTTWEGLYRYRTEDLVEIIGFYGTIPKYKFIRRRGDILSAGIEKVPEVLLYNALYTAVKRWEDKSVVDFTSVENIYVENITGTISGSYFYIVFLELGQEGQLTSRENDMVDEELVKLHEVYRKCRKNGLLQPVKMIQVQTGAFHKVKEMALQRNTAAYSLQYKLPRIMRQNDVLNYLLSVAVDV